MLDDSSFELCRWFITEAIPQSSTSLLVALSVWRLCVHPKLWNYVSHWSCHIIQMSRLLSWELVACWAAGRRDARLRLMCSKASNGVYADRGEQQEQPSLDRGSHTRASFSPRMRGGWQSAARQPLRRAVPLSEREEDGLGPSCTRLSAISEASLSFKNPAQAFVWSTPPFLGAKNGVGLGHADYYREFRHEPKSDVIFLFLYNCEDLACRLIM